MTGSTGDIGNK